MNKYAAEKIASEYYDLGVQLALQESGLVKTADPTRAEIGRKGFSEGAPGLTPVPYTQRNATMEAMADKYDTDRKALRRLSNKGAEGGQVARLIYDSLGGRDDFVGTEGRPYNDMLRYITERRLK